MVFSGEYNEYELVFLSSLTIGEGRYLDKNFMGKTAHLISIKLIDNDSGRVIAIMKNHKVEKINDISLIAKKWFLTDKYSAKDILPNNFIKL